MRELPLEDGAVGKRYLFEFLLPPATGHVILRGAVSEKSAEDAAAAFASDPAGFDFDARAEDARLAWEKILGPVDADGEFKARRAFVTALYGAYVQPEGKDGKTYRVRIGDEHATVRVTGPVNTASRLVSAKVNGQPVADLKKIAKDFLKPGDVLTLELNKTKPTGLSGTATRPGRRAP